MSLSVTNTSMSRRLFQKMADNIKPCQPGQARSGQLGPANTCMTDESRTFTTMRTRLEQTKKERHQRIDEEKKDFAERLSEKEREHDDEIARRCEEFQAYQAEKDGEVRKAGINIVGLGQKLTNSKLELENERQRISEAEKRYEAGEGTIKKLRDQMKANREKYDMTLGTMEEKLKKCLEVGRVQNGQANGVGDGEMERLATDKERLADEVKVLRKRCESKIKKLGDAEDRLAHKKRRKEDCLKERKSEYDHILSNMQEKCDREVNVMRERKEEEKEALRNELHRQNDLNCNKSDEQIRLLVEGHKEVVRHHGQEMVALRSTLQAEKEKMKVDIEEMERKWKEERGRLEDLLQREKDNREQQRDEYEDFKKLLREEKIREIEFVKVKCVQEKEGLNKEHSEILAQKGKKMLSLAEGHREEMGAKAAEYEQETSKLKDEMAALRQTFDKDRAGQDKSLTDLITKHRKSEKDLETYYKEKEEKLRDEVESLKVQLSEKINEIELLQCQVTLQS
ncbi:golgin subfamily A member 6-like protein 25 [Lineus longissimus]|uniref:golgin subfamily A member 6-like protein 25 n=1 Tax=Lineus longissimus TaxID=88925 RepID=UPI00315C55B3